MVGKGRGRDSHGNVAGAGRFRSPGASSSHGSSFGITLGRIGNHGGGYVSFGGGSHARAGVTVGLFHHNSGHHSRGYSGHSYYPSGHYYYGYSPLHYLPYSYYPASYGLAYFSSYYDAPYRYSSYGYDDAYEQDSTVGLAVPDESLLDRSANAGVLSAPYQRVMTPDGNGLLAEGNGALKAGQYDAARSFYVRAMLMDERDGYAKLLYAVASFAVGEYAVAETALRRALLTAPEVLDVPFDLRQLFAHADVWETHLGDLVGYHAGHPEDRGAALLLAYLHYASGDAVRALAVLPPLAKSDPIDVIVTLLQDRLLELDTGN